MKEKVDKKRRRLVKLGSLGILAFAGYRYWKDIMKNESFPASFKPDLIKPEIVKKTKPKKEVKPEEEVNLDDFQVEQYPENSPFGHNRPYLVLEPSNTSSSSLQLICKNNGGGDSTAILEVFRIIGAFRFPLILSELEKIEHIPVYLPSGSSFPVSLNLNMAGVKGFLFVLSDPILDPCPRRYNSDREMMEHMRHILYYGR